MYSPSQIGAFVLTKMKETAGNYVGVAYWFQGVAYGHTVYHVNLLTLLSHCSFSIQRAIQARMFKMLSSQFLLISMIHKDRYDPVING